MPGPAGALNDCAFAQTRSKLVSVWPSSMAVMQSSKICCQYCSTAENTRSADVCCKLSIRATASASDAVSILFVDISCSSAETVESGIGVWNDALGGPAGTPSTSRSMRLGSATACIRCAGMSPCAPSCGLSSCNTSPSWGSPASGANSPPWRPSGWLSAGARR